MTLQMFYDLRRVESADDKRRETVSHDSCAGMDTPLEGYMAACENAFIRAAQLQHQGHLSETARFLHFLQELGRRYASMRLRPGRFINRIRRCVGLQREYAHGISR
jgi:DNA-binding NtrC family response regulator